jgi:hypothetical protein
MKPRKTRKDTKPGKKLLSGSFRVFRGFLFGAVLFSGCHSTKPPDKKPPQSATATNAPARVAPLIMWADVAFVNEAQGYVLLRSKGLLSATGEAKVWRGTNEVARVRLGGPTRQMWLTADILSGHPRPQDRVEIIVRKNQNVESGGSR